MKILIVEDHAVLAQGLAILLQQMGHEVAHADGKDGLDAILSAAAALEPAVVLLDFHLEGQVGDSLPLIRPLSSGGAVIIMLTGEEDRARLGACIEAGAQGIAAKSQRLDEIIELVEQAARHEPLMPKWLRAELLEAARRHQQAEHERLAAFTALTRREQEVLGALIEGLAAEQAAEKFYVSVATVRTQIRSILQKLGVSSQLQAVALARQAGWEPGGLN